MFPRSHSRPSALSWAALFVWLAMGCVQGAAGSPASPQREPSFRVLVFSKTAGFRHPSIADGAALVQRLGERFGFAVETTEDADRFSDLLLSGFDAVVFLNTTGDVLDEVQQGALRRFVEGGGGFAGVHSAADTEHDWPWYGELLGNDAWFVSHPPIQTARLAVETRDAETRCLPNVFAFEDEWYNFRSNPRPATEVLLTIDETSYDPGLHPMGDHPIAWRHSVGLGRAWYTNLGHRPETYANPPFQLHLLAGLAWAAGHQIKGLHSGSACGWLLSGIDSP